MRALLHFWWVWEKEYINWLQLVWYIAKDAAHEHACSYNTPTSGNCYLLFPFSICWLSTLSLTSLLTTSTSSPSHNRSWSRFALNGCYSITIPSSFLERSRETFRYYTLHIFSRHHYSNFIELRIITALLLFFFLFLIPFLQHKNSPKHIPTMWAPTSSRSSFPQHPLSLLVRRPPKLTPLLWLGHSTFGRQGRLRPPLKINP